MWPYILEEQMLVIAVPDSFVLDLNFVLDMWLVMVIIFFEIVMILKFWVNPAEFFTPVQDSNTKIFHTR